MKYKLKKDLPTFNAGDLFELRADGCLYLYNKDRGCEHWKSSVMAYHKNTLKNFPNILKDWFEEVEDEPWKPKDGEVYEFISDRGYINNDIEHGNEVDDFRAAVGNKFRFNAGEVNEAILWLRAFKVLRDDTKGFRPDWSDSSRSKYSVGYNHELKELITDVNDCWHDNLIYFPTEADAQKSINIHQKEWLTFFGVEDD